ncbi:MAG: hypothetical protein WDO68_22185 [Gammaproteobacteria bacterium]
MAKDRNDATVPGGVDIDSMPKSLRDSIDLNNEYAGRETGRMKRFLTAQDTQGGEHEKEREERRFNALMRLLQNPDYARAYFELETMVERADAAVTLALSRNSQDAADAQDHLAQIKDNAAQAPDGRKVFRAANGRVYYESGEAVSDPALAERAMGSPSWEEFQRAQAEIERLAKERREIEDYQRDVVDPARERLGDQDNPPSKEELERRKRELETKMPEPVKSALDEINAPAAAAVPSSNSAAADFLASPGLNAPDIEKHFTAAVNFREPYGSQATPLPASVPKNA